MVELFRRLGLGENGERASEVAGRRRVSPVMERLDVEMLGAGVETPPTREANSPRHRRSFARLISQDGNFMPTLGRTTDGETIY